MTWTSALLSRLMLSCMPTVYIICMYLYLQDMNTFPRRTFSCFVHFFFFHLIAFLSSSSSSLFIVKSCNVWYLWWFYRCSMVSLFSRLLFNNNNNNNNKTKGVFIFMWVMIGLNGIHNYNLLLLYFLFLIKRQKLNERLNGLKREWNQLCIFFVYYTHYITIVIY